MSHTVATADLAGRWLIIDKIWHFIGSLSPPPLLGYLWIERGCGSDHPGRTADIRVETYAVLGTCARGRRFLSGHRPGQCAVLRARARLLLYRRRRAGARGDTGKRTAATDSG